MRVVIDATPEPDGTVSFAVHGPPDPLFTIDILNNAMRMMIAKAAEQRKAQQIEIADGQTSKILLAATNGVH